MVKNTENFIKVVFVIFDNIGNKLQEDSLEKIFVLLFVDQNVYLIAFYKENINNFYFHNYYNHNFKMVEKVNEIIENYFYFSDRVLLFNLFI